MVTKRKSTVKKNSKNAKLKTRVFKKIKWTQYLPALVIGVDEVGRGCLAGPVYAAACVLQNPSMDRFLTDSKLLSEDRRNFFSRQIHAEHLVSIQFATELEIETVNIFKASLLAMKRSVLELCQRIDLTDYKEVLVMIDGKFTIPDLAIEGIKLRQMAIVKGDLRVSPISAASIAAKVARDRFMKELALTYKEYGFDKHKGYASPFHRRKIKEIGPCPVHRKTFAGVKEYL